MEQFHHFDFFENMAKEGEFSYGGGTFYFKNWTADEEFTSFGRGTRFRGSVNSRAYPHGFLSVGFIIDGLRYGSVTHPKQTEIKKQFPNL